MRAVSEIVLVQLVHGHRRPARRCEHRSQVQTQGGRQPGADHLQKERHAPGAGEVTGPADGGDAAADHVAVAVLAARHPLASLVVVVGDLRAQPRAQPPVAVDVVSGDRPLVDLDLRELRFQGAQHRQRGRRVEQEVVPVCVDREPRRGSLGYPCDRLVHVPPRPGLDLHAGVAQAHRLARLRLVQLGRHVVVPEGQRAVAAHLLAKQAMRRHAGQLAGQVKHRHLQAGAKAVVPVQVERRPADHPLVDVGPAPGIVLDRLAPSDDPGLAGDADHLEFRPRVDARPLHLEADAVHHRHPVQGALDRSDSAVHLVPHRSGK